MQPGVDVAGFDASPPESGARRQVLLCRAGDRLVAVPIEAVLETMRPLPVRWLPGLSTYVLGVAIIRGAGLPVVDLAALFAHDADHDGADHDGADHDDADHGVDDRGVGMDGVATVGRFVSLDVAGRGLALAVGSVLGLHELDAGSGDLPPLLGALDGEVIASIGMIDHELLVVLQAGRLVPDETWATIGTAQTDARNDAPLAGGRST